MQVVTATYLALNGLLGRGVVGLPALTQNVLLAPVRVRQRVHLVLQHYVVHLAAPVAVVTLGDVLAPLAGWADARRSTDEAGQTLPRNTGQQIQMAPRAHRIATLP